jgi:hypothetical protein
MTTTKKRKRKRKTKMKRKRKTKTAGGVVASAVQVFPLTQLVRILVLRQPGLAVVAAMCMDSPAPRVRRSQTILGESTQ